MKNIAKKIVKNLGHLGNLTSWMSNHPTFCGAWETFIDFYFVKTSCLPFKLYYFQVSYVWNFPWIQLTYLSWYVTIVNPERSIKHVSLLLMQQEDLAFIKKSLSMQTDSSIFMRQATNCSTTPRFYRSNLKQFIKWQTNYCF